MESKELYVVETRRNLQPKEIPIDPAKAGDEFYRYKMRQLVVQVVGKGKMIKTVFQNLEEVAGDLRVPPDYIPHYMAKSIGATAKYDPKKPERERGHISGEYPMKELSELLQRFIRKFVLCPQCSLPEFNYAPVKKTVRLRCGACGWRGTVEDLDLDEKFLRFVTTHPPPKTERESKKQKEKAKEDGEKTNGTADGKPVRNGHKKKEASTDDWAGDTSKEAVQKRMDAMVPAQLQAIVQTDAKSLPDPVVRLKKFIENNKNVDDVIKEIDLIKATYNLDDEKLVLLISDALLPDFSSLLSRVKAHTEVLAYYLDGQPARQFTLLDDLEKKYAASKDAEAKKVLLKVLPTVLQTLLNEDILSEEPVHKWNKKKPADPTAGKELRQAAAPFIKWMEEAQSESDEEGESEEEEAPAKTATEQKKEPPRTLDEEIDAL